MRTLGAELDVSSHTLTWATCVRLTRRDAVVELYTDHDQDITVGAETFLARQGYQHAAITASTNMEPNSVDLIGPIYIDGVDEDLLRLGGYDGAFLEMYLVNWLNPVLDTVLVAGWLGEIRHDGEKHETEIRGLAQRLHDTTVVEMITPDCRADLGDARCQVDLAAFTVTGTVTTVVTARRKFTTASLPATAGGLLTWTSGANAGSTMEVKSIAGGAITLFLAMPRAIAPGDGFSVHAGCDKSLATCRDTFDNVVNFRGEPYAPGSDWLFFSPDFFQFLV